MLTISPVRHLETESYSINMVSVSCDVWNIRQRLSYFSAVLSPFLLAAFLCANFLAHHPGRVKRMEKI